jgi:hypothetical protein
MVRCCAIAIVVCVSARCTVAGAEPPSAGPTTTTTTAPALPGRLIVERPTLHCVGVRWYLDELDPERDAQCDVEHRRVGQESWRRSLPLLRVGGERVGRGDPNLEWTTPHLLAGSVLGLSVDTEYEVRLTLRGVGPQEIVHTLRSRTRAVPAPVENVGKTIEVREGRSIREAYAQAQPGDVILIHAGTYRVPEGQKIDRTDYVLDKKATADRPIVFRAAPGSDGRVVLDGDGANKLIDCQDTAYHYFEGLTLEHADHLFFAGRRAGATGLAIVGCTLRNSSFPIFGVSPDCRDFYIADNVIVGAAVALWHPRDVARKAIGGEDTHAIWLMGQGHVVCHNRISGWWDGIDLTGGTPPEDPLRQNCSIDFYANDVSECIDDAIEMDYGVHNIRVWSNRISNTFMGISAQPVYGGPAYVLRNVVYNCTRSPIKPNQWTAGLLIYHNTFVSAESAGRWAPMWQNTRIMNNLFLGADNSPGIIWTGTPTPDTSVLDYNGWRHHSVSEPRPVWFRFETDANPTERSYESFSEFTAATGFERHATIVDYDVFEHVIPPSASDGAGEADEGLQVAQGSGFGMGSAPSLDFRLREDASAIDRGTPLADINDDFKGAAPDLGAHEFGTAPPRIGPRR